MKIALDRIVVTKENPRHTPASDAAHRALMASMSTHGLLQPLVVRLTGEDGKSDVLYEVIAGTRRLRAAKELGWTEIDCIENDAEYGIAELGAAENMMREAMHPLDECDVITRLVSDGESKEDVGARFGQTVKWVDQRMGLSALSPKIAKAFRDGTLSLAAAQAYTLADHKLQNEQFGKGVDHHALNPDVIKRSLMNTGFKAENAIFDLAAYPPEHVRADLFGEDKILTDRKLFHTMQTEAIKVLAETLSTAGWGTVKVLSEGRDYTATTPYVQVAGKIRKADRAKLMAFVVYTPASGKVDVLTGYALRKDAKKIQTGKTAGEDKAEVTEVAAKTADELSDNQLYILAACQTAALESRLVGGDIELALRTLLGPLMDEEKSPAWAAGRIVEVDYTGVNNMLEVPFEGPGAVKGGKLPSGDKIGEMKLKDLQGLLCAAALRSMKMMMRPDAAATKYLKAQSTPWVDFDARFLNRYRMDQLVDLAGRMKIATEGLAKASLIDKITGEAVKWDNLDKLLKIEFKEPSA